MSARSSIVLALALGGCFIDRPNPLVLCHNSNCTEPHSHERDDTLSAMRSSLALVDDDGVPLLDGIELDVFRHEGRCLFAHDVHHLEGHVDILDAAAALADHITTRPRLSHNGEQFNVKLELKPQVDGRDDTDEQVTCTLETYEVLRTAATSSGHHLEVVFDSYDPEVLRLLQARRPAAEEFIWPKLSYDIGVPPPLTRDNYDLDKLDVPLDIIEIHLSWITDTVLRSLRARGVEISLWSFDLTRETLQQIDSLEPRFALTGQARTLRTWLDAD